MNENELKNLILDTIKNIDSNDFEQEIGKVISVYDGIINIAGLKNAFIDEIVITLSGVKAMIMSMDTYMVTALILDSCDKISAGEEVKRTGEVFKAKVSQTMIGHIFNGYGESLENKKFNKLTSVEIEKESANIMEISGVKHQIITGIKVIDWLIPIGWGQRQLILGDKFTGKTSICIDTIISLKNDPDVISIYVSIGQKINNSIIIKNKLLQNNVKNFIMFVANCSDEAAMRYLCPFVATSFGEYFRELGKKVIIFYDDLNSHAISYREICLILKRSPGRDAYPGDIFYLHSRMLERAYSLIEKGKGALTAIPIVKTTDGDISGYIPTNIISITDGQIVLNEQLFNENKKPAIDIGLSVSRVGTGIQNKFLKSLTSGLKLKLAKYKELLNITKFSSEIDNETKLILNEGLKLTNMLYQKEFNVLNLPQQIVYLYGILNNLTDINNIDKIIKDLHLFESKYNDILNGSEDIIKEILKG